MPASHDTATRVGRRLARPSRSGRAAVVMLPLLAGVLVAVGATVPGAAPDRSPAQVAVTQTSYACPLVGGRLEVASGGVAPAEDASAVALPSGDRVDDLADAATWRGAKVAKTDAVLVDQRGEESGGAGFVAGRAGKDDGEGLAIGSCSGVVDDAWFVGLGSAAKHGSRVVLTNLGDAPAVADLELWGLRGVVDAVDNTGIVVEPRSTRTVRLTDVAAGESELGLRVVRQRGALAVSVLDGSTTVARGSDLVSPQLPGERQRIVGLPRSDTSRSLLLLNPGESTARARVEVAGKEATFTPDGLDDVKVAPGQITVVSLPDALAQEDVALDVVSDQPLVAAVRVTTASDQTYVEAAAPLDGPAVVPVRWRDFAKRPVLTLTAVRRSTTVTLTAHDAAMNEVASAQVTVEAGLAVTVNLADAKVLDADDIAFVVVTPAEPVLGSATYRDGERIANLLLAPAPLTRPGPDVRPAD